MNEYVDIYCERTAQGLFNEPINAITNLGFIIAAYVLWRVSRSHSNPMKSGDYAIIINLFIIGIGSGLFHTVATRLTEWMDMIPIMSFQIIWLWLYFRRLFKFSKPVSIGLTVAYFVTNFYIATLPDPTHGSIGYLGSLLVILGLGFHYRKVSDTMPNLLFIAAGTFIVSLTLRTFDMPVCESFPLGTHFFWHCLNAVVLWCCARCVINRV